MVKKLLLIALLIPVLLMAGCDLSGKDDEVEYGTADAELIAAFSYVQSVLNDGMEAVLGTAMSADPDVDDGNFTYSNTGITAMGSVSASQGSSTRIISIVSSITFTNYTMSGSGISITGTFDMNISMEMQISDPTEMVGGSMSLTGTLNSTGADISTIVFNITFDMVADDNTGDIIIDGVYYHAADLMGSDD